MPSKKRTMHKKVQQPKNVKTKLLESQITALTDDLKRAQADFINYKRRTEADKQQLIRFGREAAVMSLLPVIDNIERALAHLPRELEKNDWAIGVRSVAKQVHDSLKAIGVEKVNSLGEEFDPNLHDAVGVEEGDGKKEIVVEELQPGYTMDGDVIRHATVKVGLK